MQSALLVLLMSTIVVADVAQSNPLGKVLQLMGSLEAKVKAQGDTEEATFKKFFEWCDAASKNTNFEISTASEKVAKLSAKIDELNSDVEVGTSKIEDLSSAISTADAELKEATNIRTKEAADFQASEAELVSTVDTLARAIAIIEKETSQGGAALAQIDMSSMQSLVQSLSVVVDAAAFSGIDRTKLLALVQSHQTEDSEDSEMGAPSSAKYESHSGGISELLEDLKEKAEGELAEARKSEAAAKHNFAMVRQSLMDKLAADQKDMDGEKAGVAAAKEGKGASSGDLAVTQKGLKNGQASLKTANTDCMRSAADHEATVAARTAELEVIAKARDILEESTGGAESQTYSFLQVAAASRSQLASNEVIDMVKRLARDQHSTALSQLASRISAVVRYGGSSGGDPFAKVKGLITDMLSKLEKAAESEATEKAYCDEQMSKTEAKKGELEDDIEKLSNKIDSASARSAELKEEVAETQSELADMAKAQAEMDNLRTGQSTNYMKAKAELTAGLDGVRKALGVLREYYGGGSSAAASMLQDDDKFGAFMQQPAAPQQHEKSSGAGGSIMSILEVVESDFATNLAKEETEEADAAASYEKMTQQNTVSKTGKDQDVKYKGSESAALDKTISEVSGDKNSASAEQAAVLEYYAKLQERCVAKPESYEDKKARRAAEINGLKEALSVLENETAFVQRKRRGGARFLQTE